MYTQRFIFYSVVTGTRLAILFYNGFVRSRYEFGAMIGAICLFLYLVNSFMDKYISRMTRTKWGVGGRPRRPQQAAAAATVVHATEDRSAAVRYRECSRYQATNDY